VRGIAEAGDHRPPPVGLARPRRVSADVDGGLVTIMDTVDALLRKSGRRSLDVTETFERRAERRSVDTRSLDFSPMRVRVVHAERLALRIGEYLS